MGEISTPIIKRRSTKRHRRVREGATRGEGFGHRASDVASMRWVTHVRGEAILVLLAHGALDGRGTRAGADRGGGHREAGLRGGIGAGERAG